MLRVSLEQMLVIFFVCVCVPVCALLMHRPRAPFSIHLIASMHPHKTGDITLCVRMHAQPYLLSVGGLA